MASGSPAAAATTSSSSSPSPSDPPKAAQHSSEPPISFTFYDVFFWRDAPDWYRKTFLSAGFGFSYCVLKQYLNRHELEVFMPPRSKILPQSMQEGYRNSQMLKYGFLKVGGEVTTIAGAAGIYYAGAWYLGLYRGGIHSWENFAVSGAAAGAGVALWLLRPLRLRPVLFGLVLGAGLGGGGAYVPQAAGLPFWDETHDFEGWFLGSRINLKNKKVKEEEPQVAAACQPPASTPATPATPQAVQPELQAVQAVQAVHGSGSTGPQPSGGRSWWSPWSRAPVPPETAGGS